MLLDSGLPKTLWAHAYNHSIYVHNRTGHSALDGKTPYEVRFGTPPDIRHLRPWGTHVWVRQEKARKLEPKGVEAFFVGFSENHRDAVHVYWPAKHNVTVVRSFVWTTEQDSDTTRTVVSEGARMEKVESDEELVGTDMDTHEVDEAGTGDAEDTESKGASSGEDKGGGADEEQAENEAEEAQEEVIKQAPLEAPMGRGHRVKKPSPLACRIQDGEGTADGRPHNTPRQGLVAG